MLNGTNLGEFRGKILEGSTASYRMPFWHHAARILNTENVVTCSGSDVIGQPSPQFRIKKTTTKEPISFINLLSVWKRYQILHPPAIQFQSLRITMTERRRLHRIKHFQNYNSTNKRKALNDVTSAVFIS